MTDPGAFPESDWRIWRDLRQKALERYCQNVLIESAKFAKGEETSHKRYLKLYRLLQDRDRELARIFDDFRRSTAMNHILLAASAKLLTKEEIELFSERTQSIIREFAGQ